jgi:hypothetical protein
MPALTRLSRHARANAVAYLALFVALGGTSAYAANTIGSADVIDESLQSVDIKNGQVKAADIGGNQITTAKIYPGSVTNSDIGTDAVTPAKLGQVPAVNTLRVGSAEVAATSANKVLHPDFDIYDTAGVHDEASASEYLVAPVDGMYVVSATIDWDPNSTGYRRSTITGPSGPVASVAGPPLPAPGYTSQNPSGVERLAAGQGVRVEVLQGSGGDLAARLSRFQMTYVGGY